MSGINTPRPSRQFSDFVGKGTSLFDPGGWHGVKSPVESFFLQIAVPLSGTGIFSARLARPLCPLPLVRSSLCLIVASSCCQLGQRYLGGMSGAWFLLRLFELILFRPFSMSVPFLIILMVFPFCPIQRIFHSWPRYHPGLCLGVRSLSGRWHGCRQLCCPFCRYRFPHHQYIFLVQRFQVFSGEFCTTHALLVLVCTELYWASNIQFLLFRLYRWHIYHGGDQLGGKLLQHPIVGLPIFDKMR